MFEARPSNESALGGGGQTLEVEDLVLEERLCGVRLRLRYMRRPLVYVSNRRAALVR